MKYSIQSSLVYLWMILIMTSFWSCDNKQYEAQKQIEEYEKQVAKQAIDAHMRPLLMAYVDYYHNYPQDVEMVPIYLYRGAVLYYRVGNWKTSLQFLENLIRAYPESKPMPDALILAASITENRIHDENRAGELYQLYLDKYPDGEYIEEANFFFKPKDVKMRARIADFQDRLYKKHRPDEINKQVAIKLIGQYTTYIRRFPEDKFTPIYCFQGARLASRVGEHIAAIELLDMIYKDYEKYEQYPDALFLMAIEYEDYLKPYLSKRTPSQYMELKLSPRINSQILVEKDHLAEAEKLYKEFMRRFPNHDLHKHAEASLKHLGKKPNDVVNTFLLGKDSLQ